MRSGSKKGLDEECEHRDRLSPPLHFHLPTPRPPPPSGYPRLWVGWLSPTTIQPRVGGIRGRGGGEVLGGGDPEVEGSGCGARTLHQGFVSTNFSRTLPQHCISQNTKINCPENYGGRGGDVAFQKDVRRLDKIHCVKFSAHNEKIVWKS